MSEVTYKIVVKHTNSKEIWVDSEVQMMVPGTFPFGQSDWRTDKWNSTSRWRKLIRAIGDAKKFAFVTFPDTQSHFWMHRYQKQDNIEMVTIKVIGDGFFKKAHLYDVQVVPLSGFPYGMSANLVCFGYTLRFQDSNIDDNPSL